MTTVNRLSSPVAFRSVFSTGRSYAQGSVVMYVAKRATGGGPSGGQGDPGGSGSGGGRSSIRRRSDLSRRGRGPADCPGRRGPSDRRWGVTKRLRREGQRWAGCAAPGEVSAIPPRWDRPGSSRPIGPSNAFRGTVK